MNMVSDTDFFKAFIPSLNLSKFQAGHLCYPSKLQTE